MKQRALRRSLVLAILMAFLFIGGESHAQNTPFQSPSLDSNCYFPNIGMSGEIDTIYGNAHDTEGNYIYGEGLGGYLHNLGPKTDGSFGKMLLGKGNVSPFVDWEETSTGSNFDLHSLKAIALTLSIDPHVLRFGHFRDRTHLDLFDEDWRRIYWADEDGNYDSSRFTILQPNIYGDQGSSGGSDGIFDPAYIAHLTSDTVDDVVTGFITFNADHTKDSLYLALFRGGSGLTLNRVAHEDTSIVMPPPYIGNSHYTLQGDFRGTGRDDLLITDNLHNLFFYKNDSPFSLERLLHSILYDTLWSRAGDPKWRDTTLGWLETFTSLAMPALPKKTSDRSSDLVVSLPTTTDSNNGIFIFRGGPDFGSHRIMIDSAAFVITKPKFGWTYWPGQFTDAGDLTGTGNHVFYTLGGDQGYAAQTFYITGRALDNKIDIYDWSTAGAFGDTLTADRDSLEDILMGLPGYTSSDDLSNGKRTVGSIWLMHGSTQIPVHLNPQFSDVRSIPLKDGAGINFTPNPATHGWSVATIIWPEAENAEYEVYDLLGTVVQGGRIRMLGGTQQQRVNFSNLLSGTYFFVVHGELHEAQTRLTVMR
ncbi:MAG: T9SS type A sorting domain-containing protein [Bacteroidota bacterium]|nr:T9SS type A sorting domain-containing protein [Bacteroidota bacterium]MDP4231874.1 T9SS type A sorting domain-containing protein [Bacteroidota bacterium]MDP4242760.1 T9SS type A sorting domain-containing protein [Bacteroidota bacterium]MDP4287211.1 T9SS type A sorting domain-containing protein [Bacteroidota bacterium]